MKPSQISDITTDSHHKMPALVTLDNQPALMEGVSNQPALMEGVTNPTHPNPGANYDEVIKTRSSNSPHINTYGPIERDQTTDRTGYTTQVNLPYSLDIPKNMLKKLETTTRSNPLSISMTGGGARLYCQTAYYEMLKSALDYCSTYPDALEVGITIENKVSKDGRGSTVQVVYRVYNGKDKIYTINCYHTQSTLLVNGTRLATFMDLHLPNIQRLIKEALPSRTSLMSMNKNIAHTIQQWFSDQNGQVDENQGRDLCICPHCDQKPGEDGIKCQSCDTTAHYACVKMTKRSFQAWKKKSNPYMCIICASINNDQNERKSRSQNKQICDTKEKQAVNTTQRAEKGHEHEKKSENHLLE